MARDLNNYLATIKEHVQVREVNLDDYAEKCSSGALTNKDYFAIERLLQMLVESGIGLAKQLVKHHDRAVRSTAFENFKELCDLGVINSEDLQEWQSMIGLRNILIHEYLDIDHDIINSVLEKKLYKNTGSYCLGMVDRFTK